MADSAHTPVLSRRHLLRSAMSVAVVATTASVPTLYALNAPEILIADLRRHGVTVTASKSGNLTFIEDDCNSGCFGRACRSGAVKAAQDNRAALSLFLNS